MHSLGPTLSISHQTARSTVQDTEQSIEGLTSAAHGAAGLMGNALPDAPPIAAGNVPPTGSPNVLRNVAANALPHVPRLTVASGLSDPPLTPTPDLSLIAPSIDSRATLEHVPLDVPMNLSLIAPSSLAPELGFGSPSSTVPSTGPSHVQLVVPSAVSSSVPARPIIQSDVSLIIPSSKSVLSPASPPLSYPPAAATPTDAYLTIASEGSSSLSTSKQPALGSLPEQRSDTLWNFPQDYAPTFSSHIFSTAPSETSVDVQLGNDLVVGASNDWSMTSGGALNTDLISADDAWDPTGRGLSPDTDAVNDLNATGRVSAANLAIIKEEFVEVQKRAKAVAEKTGLSTTQVLEYWSTVGTRTHSKRNMWNLYNSYFTANEEEELSRLPERKPITLSREVLILTLLS